MNPARSRPPAGIFHATASPDSLRPDRKGCRQGDGWRPKGSRQGTGSDSQESGHARIRRKLGRMAAGGDTPRYGEGGGIRRAMETRACSLFDWWVNDRRSLCTGQDETRGGDLGKTRSGAWAAGGERGHPACRDAWRLDHQRGGGECGKGICPDALVERGGERHAGRSRVPCGERMPYFVGHGEPAIRRMALRWDAGRGEGAGGDAPAVRVWSTAASGGRNRPSPENPGGAPSTGGRLVPRWSGGRPHQEQGFPGRGLGRIRRFLSGGGGPAGPRDSRRRAIPGRAGEDDRPKAPAIHGKSPHWAGRAPDFRRRGKPCQTPCSGRGGEFCRKIRRNSRVAMRPPSELGRPSSGSSARPEGTGIDSACQVDRPARWSGSVFAARAIRRGGAATGFPSTPCRFLLPTTGGGLASDLPEEPRPGPERTSIRDWSPSDWSSGTPVARRRGRDASRILPRSGLPDTPDARGAALELLFSGGGEAATQGSFLLMAWHCWDAHRQGRGSPFAGSHAEEGDMRAGILRDCRRR